MAYKDKEKEKEYYKKWYEKNKERKRESQRKWNENNKEKKREYQRNWNEKNKEKIIGYQKKWNEKNKEKKREYEKKYSEEKRHTDPVYKLRKNVSNAVAAALHRENGSKSGESILQHLPYSVEQLKEHLESKWAEGMSWQNYGEWHIDHIYPQSRLPYDSFYHPNFLECWKLENLQPLWAAENRKKSNKLLD